MKINFNVETLDTLHIHIYIYVYIFITGVAHTRVCVFTYE